MVELLVVHVKDDQKGRDRSTYLGIPDARTIQETQKVQERQPREEVPVDLSDKLGLIDTRHVHIGIVDSPILLTAVLQLLGIWQLFALGGGHNEGDGKRRETKGLGEVFTRLVCGVLTVGASPLRGPM